MPDTALQLTNDDEPGRLSPRRIRVIRSGLAVGDQPAVLVAVDPPLESGEAIPTVVLASRTLGVTIGEMLDRAAGRVYVCQYVGGADPMPDQLSRPEVRILFWGLISAAQI